VTELNIGIVGKYGVTHHNSFVGSCYLDFSEIRCSVVGRIGIY
jgi:hypothetical protein